MNNLPIQTYESVVQQRDALAAENVVLKSAFEKPQAYLSWHAIPPTWEDPLPCGEYLDVHDTADHKNSDGTDCWPVFAKPEIETPATDEFTRELMARGVDALQIPESFKTISDNIRTQDNRVTSHPLFAVMQKREIVVDGDYDHDRFVWVDEEGQEATDHQKRRLDLFIKNFRKPPEKWRHLAVKEINEFVTACFTEQGCKDYLDANGHNLRYPFIYVFSAHRNAEFIAVREWLAKGINDAQ